MSAIVATGAGATVVVIVLLLGAVARRGPAVRVPPGRPGAPGGRRSGSIDVDHRARIAAGPVLAGAAGLVVAGPIGLAGAGGAALVLRQRRRARRRRGRAAAARGRAP